MAAPTNPNPKVYDKTGFEQEPERGSFPSPTAIPRPPLADQQQRVVPAESLGDVSGRGGVDGRDRAAGKIEE
jgi:hypothetical protein